MKRSVALTLITLAVLAISPAASAADSTTDRWIGTWVATWADGETRTELRIDQIEDRGKVHGVYCHRDVRRPWSITDFGLHLEADPKLENDALRWQQPNRRGAPSRWEFSFRDADTLRMRFTNRHNRTHILDMHQGESKCVARWIRPVAS